MISARFQALVDLFERHHYQAVIATIPQLLTTKSVDESDTAYLDCLYVRALMHQGRFTQAFESVNRWPSTAHHDVRGSFQQLWYTFLDVYRTLEPDAVLNNLTRLQSHLHATPQLQALAWDLQARTLQIGCTMRLYPAKMLHNVETAYHQAIQLYHSADDWYEAAKIQLDLGFFHFKHLQADVEGARKAYQEVLETSLHHNHLSLQGETLLRLATLVAEDLFTTGASDAQMLAEQYSAAIDIFEDCEHGLGIADTYLSYGQSCLKLGEDPQAFLLKAFEQYEKADHLTGQQNVLSSLGEWAVYTGNMPQATVYYERFAQIAQETGFKWAEGQSQLKLGEIYHRMGHYGKARAACEMAVRIVPLPAMQAGVALIKANIDQQAHQSTSAEQSARFALSLFKQLDDEINLSLAYQILSLVLSAQKRWEEAISTLKEGLALDQSRGLTRAAVDKLQLLGDTLTTQARPTDKAPSLSLDRINEALNLYQQAFDLLKPFKDAAATAVRAGLKQTSGRLYLVAKAYEQAQQDLLAARQSYQEVGLGMQTAMTDNMLGLLYDVVARQEGEPRLFERATLHHNVAYEYFSTAGMREMLIKTAYHLARALFNQGVYANTADLQLSMWQQAEGVLQGVEVNMQAVRYSLGSPHIHTQEEARTQMKALHEDIYALAIRLNTKFLHHPLEGWQWLQRFKSRTLLESLAHQPLPAPSDADAESLALEQFYLHRIKDGPSNPEYWDLLDKLDTIWLTMAQQANNRQYTDLRRGLPLDWTQMQALLTL